MREDHVAIVSVNASASACAAGAAAGVTVRYEVTFADESSAQFTHAVMLTWESEAGDAASGQATSVEEAVVDLSAAGDGNVRSSSAASA